MHISPRRLIRDFITNFKPRELFYWLVGNLVFWGFHLGMRVERYGVTEHYGPLAPSTLIISTHKRDWDPILFASYSYYHRGWLAPDGRRIGFAGRADIWERGFLATVVGYRSWPLWAQHLLDATSFAPIANRMRGYPILRIPEFTLRQYFRMLLREEGDLPLSAVLSLDTLLAFTHREDALHRRAKGRARDEAARPLQLSDVPGWEYRPLTDRPAHARYLLPARYERLRERLRASVEQQLERLARSLDSGETLWFAPEGAVTLDGGVMRLRSGLHALLTKARPDLRCLPSNVTYDFMTNKRRMIACLSVGPELADLRALDRKELAERVAPALAHQAVVTMSMLGSARLLAHLANRDFRFKPEAEVPILLAKARRLAAQGAWVQRDLLNERRLRRQLGAFIAYARAHRFLVPDQKDGYLVSGKTIQSLRSSRYWENPLRYSANELLALEATLQPQQTIPLPALREPAEEPPPAPIAEPQNEVNAEAGAPG